MAGQMEIASTLQLVNTHTFLRGNSSVRDFLDDFHSAYSYSRVGYGLAHDLTLSVEGGYWFNKTQIGINHKDTNASSGIGDLIIFPRYTVYRSGVDGLSNELTIGLGMKLPLGSYNDSLSHVEPVSGTTYWVRKPLAVQTTTGSTDVMFYAFYFHGNTGKNINFFANALYIHKGWNSLGERLGDFASIGLFASTNIYDMISGVLQVRGEWVDQMQLTKETANYSVLSYDPFSTGYKKVFVSPQISYCYASALTMYVMADIPLYQYVTGTQIASQFQMSMGLSYRFILRNDLDAD